MRSPRRTNGLDGASSRIAAGEDRALRLFLSTVPCIDRLRDPDGDRELCAISESEEQLTPKFWVIEDTKLRYGLSCDLGKIHSDILHRLLPRILTFQLALSLIRGFANPSPHCNVWQHVSSRKRGDIERGVSRSCVCTTQGSVEIDRGPARAWAHTTGRLPAYGHVPLVLE